MKNKIIEHCKYYIILTCCICAVVCPAQTQLIQNGGFETSSGLTCTQTSGCGNTNPGWGSPAFWSNANWTSDWYPLPSACNGNGFPALVYQPPLSSGHGSHFIGDDPAEAFQQLLTSPLKSKLKGHCIYKFECDFAWAPFTGNNSATPQFTLYLSNNSYASAPDWCTSATSWSNGFPAPSYTSQTFSFAGLPYGTWTHVTYEFSVPDNQDGIFRYLVIQAQGPSYDFTNFIDNVSLEEEDYCACDANSSYTTGFGTNAQPSVCCGFGSTAAYSGSGLGDGSETNPYDIVSLALYQGTSSPCEQPWFVEVTNAIQANVYFFNRLSNIVYSYSLFQAAGLADPGYPNNKAIFWDGTDYNGNALPSDVYIAQVVLYNPCWGPDSIVYEGNVTILPSTPCVLPPQQFSSSTDFTLQNCCTANEYFQDITYTLEFSTQVSNDIYAGSNVSGGPTGPVVVASGSNVSYFAGNNIFLMPGFSVSGGTFVSKIQPCQGTFRIAQTGGTPRPSPIFTTDSDKHSVLINKALTSVYPNPASTKLNVETQLANGEIQNICIYNSIGEKIRCVELNENLTTIEVSNLAQGIYFYRINDMQGNLIKADKITIVQ